MILFRKRVVQESKGKVYDLKSSHEQNMTKIKAIMDEVSKPVDNIRRPVSLLKQLGR